MQTDLEKEWEDENLRAAVIFLFGLMAFWFLRGMFYLGEEFPNAYVWGEIFIRYTDGFIRRGLVGTGLWGIAPFISVQFVWTLVSAALLFLFLKRFWQLLRSVFPALFCLLFFFGPAGASFLVRDPRIFGRKDILILGLLGLILWTSTQAIIHKITAKKAVCLCFVYWWLALLIHEITVFFSILPLVLFAKIGNKEFFRSPFLWIGGACILLGTWLACHFSGTVEMKEAMFAGWHELFPSFTVLGGMDFIGKSLNDNIATTYRWLQCYNIRISIVYAFILSIIPILLFFKTYNFFDICSKVIGKLATVLSIFLLLSSFILLIFIINDFGRIIAYTNIIFILFASCVSIIYKKNFNSKIDFKLDKCIFNLNSKYIFIITLFYIFSWKLLHCVPLYKNSSIVLFGF